MLKQLASFVLVIFMLTGCNALSEEVADSQEVVEQATEVPATVEASAEPVIEPTIEASSVAIEVEPTIEPTAEPVVIEATVEPTSISTVVEPTVEATSISVSNAYNAPEWTNLTLINARTGESFTLADFAGKTVFVEPMATWCPNCRAQQGQVSQAMSSLNTDDFIFISLSVGENVSNAVLADYASRNGFPQIFVVAGQDISNALVEQFGFSVLSPPSTPHFIISPSGTVSSLVTGSHRADMLIEEVTNAQNS